MWSNNDGMDPSWKPDYTHQADVVDTLKQDIAKLKRELEAACEHVERLCEERSKLRKVVEAAREVYKSYGDPGDLMDLDDALKKLDGEHDMPKV